MKNRGEIKYKKVLLKLSGEALSGKNPGENFNIDFMEYLAKEIAQIYELGVKIGIVTGGGNIFRGLSGTKAGIDRAKGDYMGMLATIINALGMSEFLEKRGCPCNILAPFPLGQFVKSVSRFAALEALGNGKIVLFAGGTGNPFFTTDSAAALRAIESQCDVLLKATNVDGIYERDPRKYPGAKFLPHISYQEALEKNIQVMDLTAFSLCKEFNMPIIVFNIHKEGNILKAVKGINVGSQVGFE